MTSIRHTVDTALGRRSADLVLRGGRVVVTTTGEILPADIAIAGDRIAHVGECRGLIGPETDVLVLNGAFVMPGFIDGHLHPENSRLRPAAAARVLLAAGTTSIVSGLDHTAAAAGVGAVREAIDEFTVAGLTVHWGSPFKLPYTLPASTLRHPWGESEHRHALDWSECIGLWELCPGFVEAHDPDLSEAIGMAHERRLGVYGSVPATDDAQLISAHVAAGLRIDHEAFSRNEMLTKLRLGLFSLIRDSAVENFLETLIELIVEQPHLSHVVGFCTDGFTVGDVMDRGHINRVVRDTVAAGVDAVSAIQMATINTARAYRIDHMVGSLSPGRIANIVVTADLRSFVPLQVIARGAVVSPDVSAAPTPKPVSAVAIARSEVHADDLVPRVNAGPETARVIHLTDNAFDRRLVEEPVDLTPDVMRSLRAHGLAVVAYVNAHARGATRPGLGLVRGFGPLDGALATSSTPDDENILCVGSDAHDMAIAINAVIGAGGADVVVSGGRILDRLDLPLHGIMSALDPVEFRLRQDHLHHTVRGIGCRVDHPMSYLGLLAITGVPEVGMSEHGPVAYASRSVVQLFAPGPARGVA